MLQKAKELCEQHQAELLYLVKFGSHLYGTDTENSDLDYKGIFLPSIQSLILNQASKSIHYSTALNCKNKHEAGDIEIELFSLQYWLNHLLKKGETIGLDLLFSCTNKECIIYDSKKKPFFPMVNIIKLIDKLLTSAELMKCAYVKYAIGQAKKYGIKGSRLGVLKRVLEYLVYLRNLNKGEVLGKLEKHIDSIILNLGDDSYCFQKEINGVNSLVLCGKVHQGGIQLQEFYDRVRATYETYGHRARLAEQNQGVDWKALSHALRAIYQMEQLFTEGIITFPLLKAEELLKVKQGHFQWQQVEKMISGGLARLEDLANHSTSLGKWDQKWINGLILSTYNYTTSAKEYGIGG
jgi:predicted nucleotidyltransferase